MYVRMCVLACLRFLVHMGAFLVGDSVYAFVLTVCLSVVQMSHAMQVKPADSEGKAGTYVFR